jgi:hypothetical protein
MAPLVMPSCSRNSMIVVFKTERSPLTPPARRQPYAAPDPMISVVEIPPLFDMIHNNYQI